MNLIIGADIVPTDTNAPIFSEGNAENLVGAELKAILDSAAYRIFNLETPLTDEATPIPKGGPNLIAPVSAVKGYRALGIDLLTVANNHILDQGIKGLKTTLKALEDNSIAYVGVGDNAEDAAKPYYFEFESKKIGVYACAEHEFSIVNNSTPGANPFDAIRSYGHILEMKANCDYIIVLYHGGKEHYRYPSLDLQKVCRGFVDSGANLVVCQHSHCIGCEEKYRDGTIVYGQGNFLFDHSKKDEWKTGLLIKLDESFNVSYIPVVKNENTVLLADSEKSKEIISAFEKRGEEIKSPEFIEKKYTEFSMTMIDGYLRILSGKKMCLPYKVLNKLLKGKLLHFSMNRRFNKRKLLSVLNVIECEAHRELIIQALKNKTL
ncbi:MAG: CapA family protein [Ruminococcaceae bacterium]|nr:CapA family protein [Oscillospiraceae bacterium]